MIAQNELAQAVEKEELEKLKIQTEEALKEMEKQLKGLKEIDYQLYYEMVVNGLNANRAVEKVAFEFDLSPSTIWKRYYPKVKEKIKNLKE